MALSGCEKKVDSILSNFNSQVEGEWISIDVEIDGNVNTSIGVPNEIKVKFSPCTQSPCDLRLSFDQLNYVNLSYDRGMGTSGTSLDSKVVLAVNSFTALDGFDEREKYFLMNMKNILIQEYNNSKLKIEIPLQGGPKYNATFTRF